MMVSIAAKNSKNRLCDGSFSLRMHALIDFCVACIGVCVVRMHAGKNFFRWRGGTLCGGMIFFLWNAAKYVVPARAPRGVGGICSVRMHAGIEKSSYQPWQLPPNLVHQVTPAQRGDHGQVCFIIPGMIRRTQAATRHVIHRCITWRVGIYIVTS